MANAKLSFSSVAAVAIAIVLVVVVGSAPGGEATLSCGTVSSNLAPCINYAKSGGSLPQMCCKGITNVNNLASTPADRQQACRCLQQAASVIRGLNLGLVAGLPAKCGVKIPYKISPSTNCNSVR